MARQPPGFFTPSFGASRRADQSHSEGQDRGSQKRSAEVDEIYQRVRLLRSRRSDGEKERGRDLGTIVHDHVGHRFAMPMKTLFLVRHAKSSRDEPALPDKDRPLNDRGKRDAPKMGERLAKRAVKADLILSSPAKRALKTAQIFAKKLDYKLADIVVDERLYAAGSDDLLDVIRKLGARPKSVMLFGHNPELTDLAHRLSKKIAHLPTCAIAEFTFDAKSWSTIGKDKPVSAALYTPR